MTKPTIPGYTANELDSLTPEELSALESDSGDNEEELKLIAGEGDETKPEAAAGEEAPTGEEAEAPVYVAVAPADAATQLEALKQAKTEAKTEDRAALKKMIDGEIDFDEYEAIKTKTEDAIDAANEQITSLNKAIGKAEIAGEISQQEAARAWGTEVSALMTAAKTQGLDYKGNDVLSKELNGLVRAFGQEATENGMSDEGLKASKWALQQAHSMMLLRHPEMVKTATAKPNEPGQPRHHLTTLNLMPNADRALGDNDAIAKLGMLEGDDLERAMASMSKADVDKLMASV